MKLVLSNLGSFQHNIAQKVFSVSIVSFALFATKQKDEVLIACKGTLLHSVIEILHERNRTQSENFERQPRRNEFLF